MKLKKDHSIFSRAAQMLTGAGRAAMLLLAVVMLGNATTAQTYEEITYVDARGNSLKARALVISEVLGVQQVLYAEWYYVDRDIYYDGIIRLASGHTSDINIILCDGVTLTITQPMKVEESNEIVNLNIYGQTKGTGTLNCGSSELSGPVIEVNGDITFNGGIITATSEDHAFYAGGKIDLNGGIVTANCPGYGFYGAQSGINFNGAIVTANNYDSNHGLFFNRPYYDGTGASYSGPLMDQPLIEGKSMRPYDYGTVTYIDEDGKTQSHEATVITNTVTSLAEGWYWVKSDVSIDHEITLDGNVNLVLGDGKTMTVTEAGDIYGHKGNYGIYSNGINFTIYGQSVGTGTLNVTATEYANGAAIRNDNGSIKIHGGIVNVTCSSLYNTEVLCNPDGIAIDGNTDDVGLFITGGKVTVDCVRGYGYGLYINNNLSITGGQVTVRGNNGIRYLSSHVHTNDDFIVGCSNPTDFIKASNISIDGAPSVVIAGGQTLTDGTNLYSGTLYNGKANAKYTSIDAFNEAFEHDVTLRPDLWGMANGNDGSKAKPYIISSTAGLDLLATNVNGGTTYSGKFFKLGADITYSHKAANEEGADTENNYTAIGYMDGSNDYSFCGTFDGCGYSISGIRIYKAGTDNSDRCQGVFGQLGSEGTIKNLNLKDAHITGYMFVGGIAGINHLGTLTSNLVMNANISGQNYVGAILGQESNGAALKNNYYSNCTVGSATNGIGCGSPSIADISTNDGAVYATILSETQASMPTLNNGDKVVFRREFTEDKASTVCLPFGIDATQAAAAGKFFTFVGVDKTDPNDWIVTMQETAGNNMVDGALTANTPYLFKPAATGPVLFYGEAADDITAGTTPTTGNTDGWVFRGTYERINWPTDPQTIYGFAAPGKADLAEGKFFRVKGGSNSYILPFRAYLDAANGGASARGSRTPAAQELPDVMTVRLISAEGTPTATGTLDTRTGEVTFDSDTWYSLDGRRLDGKPNAKGVYINSGKKVVIKWSHWGQDTL